MKKYYLPMTKDYVGHWSIVEAVRELMQNAIDAENENPANKKQIAFIGPNKNVLRISNKLSKLTLKTLLLGCGNKKNQTHTLGQFGEGYKLAILVLLRLGYSFSVQNGKENWLFSFEYNEDFDEEIFCLKIIESRRTVDTGLTFIIRGITPEVVEEIERGSLYFGNYNVLKTPIGDIVVNSQEAFVGGLATNSAQWLCNFCTSFSFNFLPGDVHLDRDRRSLAGLYDTKMTKTICRILEQADFGYVSSILLAVEFYTMGIYGLEDYLSQGFLEKLCLECDIILQQPRELDSDEEESPRYVINEGHNRLPQLLKEFPGLVACPISERMAAAFDRRIYCGVIKDAVDRYKEEDRERILHQSNLESEIVKWIQNNYESVDEDALYSLIDLFDIPEQKKQAIKDIITQLKEID